MTTKLKNCPFCGGRAEFKQFANPRNFVKVECAVCHCGTDGFRNNVLEHSLSENKKVQANIWNRRNSPEVNRM